MRSPRLSRRAFEALVARALASIPARFRPYLDNVVVEVTDRPSRETLREMELGPDEALYGLYEGTPLTERELDAEPLLPDRVTIYQIPLEEDFGGDPEEIVRQIRVTVIHEVGHHFGLSDDDMERLEDG